MKILLLDPDEYYHQEFADRLGPEFHVIPAANLDAARRALSESRPDALVTELLLDEDASFPVIAEVFRGHIGQPIPVIVFSRISHAEDIEAALGLGVSGYFVKGRDSISDVHKLLLSLKQP